MLNKIKSCWLTLNRACQLRCAWCYAESAQFSTKDVLDFALAEEIIQFCKEIGIKRVTLLGGEPTLYKRLLDLLDLMHKNKMEVGIVSNGIRFSDQAYAETIGSYVNGVTISLKAGNEKSFNAIAGSNRFAEVVEGISNLKKFNTPFNVSVLLSKSLQNDIVGAIALAARLEVPFVQVDTCNPTVNGNEIMKGESLDPNEIAIKTVEIYNRTKQLPIKVNFAIRTPFCLFPPGFIDELRSEDRLIAGCQLHRQDGIIFNTTGEVIPCNLMCEQPLGRFKDDFSNKSGFEDFQSSSPVQEFYSLTRKLPSDHCYNCQKYSECCGGCLIKWLYYNPQKFIHRCLA